MLRDRIDDATAQPLRDALREVRPGLVAVAGVSFFLNLLAFAPALYMMSGFDRVIASRNPVTWAFLTGLLVVLGVAYAALSGLRSRALVRIGVAFDGLVGERLFEAVSAAMIRRGAGAAGPVTPVQAMRDLDVVRDTFAGRLVVSATDLLFAPLFLAGCVLLHPLIGLAALVAMAVLGLLGILMNRAAAPWTLRALAAHVSASEFAGTILRNAETIRALGMAGPLQLRWKRLRDAGLDWGASAADAGTWAGGGVAFLTFVGSTLVAAVALLLVVENIATTSVLFGAMILSGKALAPMAALAGNWKSYLSARYAFQRIERIFSENAAAPDPMPLPHPQGRLALEAVTAGPPGGDRAVVHDVSLTVEPGEIVGIVGPSGSGKTCLARIATGVWPTMAGAVRLDGAELHHWAPDDLGRVMGYLPQDVELFPGTVAENIARFTAADAESIVRAARRAGVHALIQGLPDGYNTVVGDRAGNLSGGQRQRIALARALFGDPPLIVLDEPNSSLDARGEESLVAAMKEAAAAGAAVLLITHRSNIMANVDRIVVLSEGRVQTMGSRDEVLGRLGVRSVPRLRTAGGRPPAAAAAAAGSS